MGIAVNVARAPKLYPIIKKIEASCSFLLDLMDNQTNIKVDVYKEKPVDIIENSIIIKEINPKIRMIEVNIYFVVFIALSNINMKKAPPITPKNVAESIYIFSTPPIGKFSSKIA